MSYTQADHVARQQSALGLLREVLSEARQLENLLRTAPTIRHRTAGEPNWLLDLREAHRKLFEAHALALKGASPYPDTTSCP